MAITHSVSIEAERRRERVVAAILAVLLFTHVGLLAYSAWTHSPVVDEPAHVAAGLSYWYFGDFSLYRVNPPLVRLVATLPLLGTSVRTDWTHYVAGSEEREELLVGDDWTEVNGKSSFFYVSVARLACIPFALVGAVVSFKWANALFGALAGIAATTLWCFSPTILGHGSLATPDVAGTALGMAACYTYCRWIQSPDWSQAIISGVVLGAAEAAKSTLVILFVLYPVVWSLALPIVRRSIQAREVWQLVSILILGWAVLIGIYGGQRVGEPIGSLPMKSRAFSRLFGEPVTGVGAQCRTDLKNIPIPFPKDYVAGLDAQCRDLDGPNLSFLQGQWRSQGWLQYYAYAIAVKEPLGVLVLVVLSLAYGGIALAYGGGCRALNRCNSPFRRLSGLILLVPFSVFIIASIHTGMNHHVRYVMPCVPAMNVVASGLFATGPLLCRARRVVGGILVGTVIVSSMSAFPHSLSYFNEWVGGPAAGLRHLNNSNIDWGQDLLMLAKWKQSNAPNEPLGLAYFGRINPALAGIDFEVPPVDGRTKDDHVSHNSVDLKPGWYAISATLLQGRPYLVPTPDGEGVNAALNAFSYFRDLPLHERVGYSIYVYKIEKPMPCCAGRRENP